MCVRTTRPATVRPVSGPQKGIGLGANSQTDKPVSGDKQATGGRKSRDKGNRTERAVVKLLQGAGFAAERIPLSGSAGGSFCGDITVPFLDRTGEVKCRGAGFSRLYSWDFLVIKADRCECLVVVPLRFAIEVAKKAEGQA